MNFQTLNLLFRCSKEFNHETIRLHDLNDTECMICSFVYAAEGCSQEDVGKALRLDKTTVGKSLQKLEEKGYIIREQDRGDRRKKMLRLSAAGIDQLADIMDLHDSWLNSVMSCLSPEEQYQFESYCVRLLTTAEELLKTKPEENPKS